MNDLRQLKHFVALAECGHFAKAAEQVHLSQPALSRSIQALEQRLNTQLLDRHSRGVHLTAQGQLVLEHATRLLAASTAMHNALSQLNHLEQGELKLGAGPYPAARLVPKALAQLSQQAPNAKIKLSLNDWHSLRQALLADEIELFVADIRDLSSDPALHIKPLTPHRCVVFCRPEHPLLKAQTLDAKTLLSYPLAGTKLPTQVSERLQAFAEHTRPVSIECDNLLLLKTLVAQSDVLSIAPWDVLDEDVRAGRLCVLPAHAYGQEYSAYGLVSRQGYSLSPLAQAFCQAIEQLDQASKDAQF